MEYGYGIMGFQFLSIGMVLLDVFLRLMGLYSMYMLVKALKIYIRNNSDK